MCCVIIWNIGSFDGQKNEVFSLQGVHQQGPKNSAVNDFAQRCPAQLSDFSYLTKVTKTWKWEKNIFSNFAHLSLYSVFMYTPKRRTTQRTHLYKLEMSNYNNGPR